MSRLNDILEKYKMKNKENEGKPLTYKIEANLLMQWLLEKNIEAEQLPIGDITGHDGGERGNFEREYGIEYRRKLYDLQVKYNCVSNEWK